MLLTTTTRLARRVPLRLEARRWLQTKLSPPPVAFAFDIDGVLVRGSKTLPCTAPMFKHLLGDNPFRRQIPFILLTNGGGVSEKARAEALSHAFQAGFELKPEQVVQAHTVLKKDVDRYRDKNVLVLGGKGDEVRRVAESYGYRNVFTTLDVLAWDSGVWSLHQITDAEEASAKKGVNFTETPIDAVFIFHDPRNWALDIQILCDVIQSGGRIGAPYVDQGHKPVELVFCNPDLIWKADFPQPRLGQGAFKDAFQAVYKSLTGQHYPYVQYGKPTKPTYDFAREALAQQFKEIYGSMPEETLFCMVGDNPESDIAGANNAGWNSTLVHTGVYDPTKGSPAHTPTQQAEDVFSAVKQVLIEEFERSKGQQH
ncbi:HAD-superfamily hydrolase [Cylindrobasidium torrendii FP15055 ss-10]|uniref:HAD-superfamily hydrolase n=1 Tax=Cylindrobasidium torrendii FP15055 ss-10 TaxID=1314674 RepID=A0A0D7BKW4_9AGAR|nr:HAD-superfamily hydrolase [Cylindrobasidium torrendii FP15055 ss-10]